MPRSRDVSTSSADKTSLEESVSMAIPLATIKGT